jgi:hypothetical protein
MDEENQTRQEDKGKHFLGRETGFRRSSVWLDLWKKKSAVGNRANPNS